MNMMTAKTKRVTFLKAVFMATVVLLGVFWGGHGHSVQAEEENGQKVYVVGLDDSFAPMGFRNSNGELVGFDIDLAKAVAEKEGWKLKFQTIDWALKETELDNGNIDMIWNGFGVTKEREEAMTLSETYLIDGQLIITKKGSPIKELKDLKGKKIATQAGSTTAEFIKDWPNNLYNELAAPPVLYSDYNSVFADLDSGRVDAIVTSEAYGLYTMKQRGEDKYAYFKDPSTEGEKMAVAVKKGNTALVDKINEGLNAVKASGEYDKIHEKWFGNEANQQSHRSLIAKVMPSLLEGVKLTILLFAIVIIVSVPLGFILAIPRVFANKFIQRIIAFYIFVMRGSPLMLQLMIVFFGLPYIGISLDRFSAALFAFIINYTAYLAEIFRGGIASVSKGQYESIEVLGIGRLRGFRRIIFPQVLKIVLPSIGNEVIALVKDTSLVYVLGLGELLRAGSIASNTYASITPYLMCGAIYLILTAFLTYGLNRAESRLKW